MKKDDCAWGIVLAMGQGQRMDSGAETAFLAVGQKTVIAYSLMAFEACSEIQGVVVVAERERRDMVITLAQRFGCTKLKAVVEGPARRRGCLEAGLAACGAEVGYVTVQDGSFPCVRPELIRSTLESAGRFGCAIVAARVREALKTADRKGAITGIASSDSYWSAQTPQSFRRDLLQRALEAARRKRVELDDASEALVRIGADVRIIPNEGLYPRIRTADDLAVAALVLR